MSETQWTPGPWRVKADGIDVGPPDAFSPFGGCGCCGSPWMSAATSEGALADAHLIAAAPDLYEALDLMLQRYGYETCEYAQKSQTALAKARGEQ